ncbi:hypothetical protein BC938DRAFT_482267 [Jimgerdemannia flammicorona]|uniref:Homeobox domain-containing protein n=1 Tax=Jimgerdemannia flammicorona TaxID=994334 RepID=A0A433QWM4_9FUNG|nr:hypothetical protein BC938DRAFT_482267 [Jimgerdemannia flammicorona]
MAVRAPDYTMNEPPRKKNFVGVHFNNPYDSEEDDIYNFNTLAVPGNAPQLQRTFSDTMASLSKLKMKSPTPDLGVDYANNKYCDSPRSSCSESDENRDNDDEHDRSGSEDKNEDAVKMEGSAAKKDDDNNTSASSKSKHSTSSTSKKRTRATPEQLAVLEETFVSNTSPNSKVREQLAEKLNMSERSIQIWFQNRRAKVKTIQKRAHLLQEEAMKAQFLASGFPGQMHPAGMFPFRAGLPPHGHPNAGRIPLPRSYSSDMLHNIQQQMNPGMRSSTPPPMHGHPNAGLGISMPGIWPPTPQFAAMGGPQFLQGPGGVTYVSNGVSAFPSPAFSPSPSASPSPQPQLRYLSPTPVGSMMSPTPMPNPYEQRQQMPAQLDIRPPYTMQNPHLISAPSPNVAAHLFSADTLIINSWRRMKINATDLLCYYNIPERKMSWHITDNTSHFKMDFSFEAITSLDYILLDGVFAKIEIELNGGPLFYMENTKDGMPTGPNGSISWTQCSDFTEGKQASRFFKHSLKGLAQPLKNEVLEITAADERMHKVTRIVDQLNLNTDSTLEVKQPTRRHSYDNFRYIALGTPTPVQAPPEPEQRQHRVYAVAEQTNNNIRHRRAASVPTPLAPASFQSPAGDQPSAKPANIPIPPPITEVTPPTPTNMEHPSQMQPTAAYLSTYRTTRGPHGSSPLSMMSSADEEEFPFPDASTAYNNQTVMMSRGMETPMQMWAPMAQPEMGMVDSSSLMMGQSMMMGGAQQEESDPDATAEDMASQFTFTDSGDFFDIVMPNGQVVTVVGDGNGLNGDE